MQGTLHLSLSSLVARQEHQSRRKKEMCTHMAASRSWYCREKCRTGGFRRRVKYFRKKKRVHCLFILLWRYDPCEFLLRSPQKTFDTKIDEVHLNLVQQCLSAVKYRPCIEKVLHSVLVRSSGHGAPDLTTSVERLEKVHHNAGGYANVHRCKLDLRGINAIQQAVFRYQSPLMSTCVDVAVKEIILRGDTDMLTIIDRLFRELTLWLKLEHKNIVPLWGVADGFGSLPSLVSPWLENGALTGYLRRVHERLSYNEKFALLKDIAEGLQYLHSQSITHGDLSGTAATHNRYTKR
ncbi:kinase-like domain-containing protein [Suillus variegatus]|nr:kinase-like domain-containing protein [Suillus variegatus]